MLSVQPSRRYMGTILELRRCLFPEDYRNAPTSDAFDEKSWHCILRHRDEICSYSRLVPGPNSVFEKWTRGAAEIPTGEKVVDLNRMLVAPGFQGRGLFKRLLVESLAVAFDLEFETVVGTVIPGDSRVASVFSLGFKSSGPIVEEFNAEVNPVTVQPVVLDRNELNWRRVLNLRSETRRKHAELHFEVFQ